MVSYVGHAFQTCQCVLNLSLDQWSMVNGLLFHMTQPTSRSII